MGEQIEVVEAGPVRPLPVRREPGTIQLWGREVAPLAIAAGAGAAAGVAAVVVAHAAKPEREVVPFEGTGFPFFPCSEFGYDFDILVDFFGSDTVTSWRDSEGNVTRIKIHDYGTGTIYPDTDPTPGDRIGPDQHHYRLPEGDVHDLRSGVPQKHSR